MMNIFKCIAIWAGVVAVLCSVLSCDSEPPTKPNEPKDYIVYSYLLNSAKNILTYHTLTRAIDSFAIPIDPVYSLTASADGKLLYAGVGDSVAVVSLTTLTEIKRLPGARAIVSPDNRYVALAGWPWYIFRTSDYSLVYHDTDYIDDGAFTRDGRHFYGVYSETYPGGGAIAHVTLGDSVSVERTSGLPLSYSRKRAALSPDEHVLYIVDEFRLLLWDMTTKQFDTVQVRGYGPESVVPTKDGQRVFLTKLSCMLAICSPEFSPYQALNVTSQTMFTAGNVSDICGRTGHYRFGPMVISPDGAVIVAIEEQWNGGLGRDIIRIDPDIPDSTDILCLDRPKQFLTCQVQK